MQPDTPETPRLYPLAALLDSFTADAQARWSAKQQGRALGALTGHKRLNERIGGCLAPGLHVLHGSPGSGKSAFALQMAATCGCPALFVSCEMSPLELMRRLTARATKTYLGKLKTGEMHPKEVNALAQRAVAAAPLLGLLDATAAPATPEHLHTAADTMRQLAPANPHLLIVVDSVHSWVRGMQSTLTETEALIAGLDGLRQLAQAQNCALLGVAERNRAAMKSDGQSAAAGTRVFEYAAESVFGLTADEQPDASGRTVVTLAIPKNRHGTPGAQVKYQFHGATQEFTEVG